MKMYPFNCPLCHFLNPCENCHGMGAIKPDCHANYALMISQSADQNPVYIFQCMECHYKMTADQATADWMYGLKK